MAKEDNTVRRQIPHKICRKCKKLKPITDFYGKEGRRFGVGSHCKKCYGESTMQIRKDNPERAREWYRRSLLKKFSISIEEYEEMHRSQDGKCAICKREETRIHLSTNQLYLLCVDHDHVSGKNRQLLCHSCNTGIGHFLDNPEFLDSAAEYLRRHGK